MKSRNILIVFCLAMCGFKRIPEIGFGSSGMTTKKDFSAIPSWMMHGICTAGTVEPWTAKQLMAPAELAAMINDPNAKKPVIICVGPGALIKGSLDVGPVNEKINLEKLKQQLSKLSHDADVVIYCGCCPFEHCPNIRPAFILLNEMKFSNAHLLNIEHNLKTDWISKGYPKA